MQILVIFDPQTLELKRLVGPMPVPIEAHVGEGEAHYICDTTTPKHPAEIHAEVIAYARGQE